MLVVNESWVSFGGSAGVLVLRCGANPPVGGALEDARRRGEKMLRDRFGSFDRTRLRELPVFREYVSYYKRFDKSYQVLMQLESVALKGKEIPPVSSLVTAMFLAELESGVLTAGHDLERLVPPLSVATARGGERYQLLGKGKEQDLKAGDMCVSDGVGIIGSIVYGPDQRTRIDESTKDALFLVYGAPGVGAGTVRTHLERLAEYVRLALPEAEMESLEVVEAGK